MTEDPPAKPASEPSMDDILASIRRILAEDTEEKSEKVDPAQPLTSDIFDNLPDETEAAAPIGDRPGAGADEADETAPPPSPAAADVFLLTPEMRADAAPPVANETRLVPPPAGEFPATAPAAGAQRVVSSPTADVSADVLSQLAKAILDRRDIAVETRDVTLEGMVREMLRPLLREWLDRNLPYLIERLVKKEIDFMVNRAERLDD